MGLTLFMMLFWSSYLTATMCFSSLRLFKQRSPHLNRLLTFMVGYNNSQCSLPHFNPQPDGMLVYGNKIEDDGSVSITQEELNSIASRVGGGEGGKTATSDGLLLRTVPVDSSLSVRIYELEDPSPLVHNWIENHSGSGEAKATTLLHSAITDILLLIVSSLPLFPFCRSFRYCDVARFDPWHSFA